MSAVDLIKKQHREVENLFQKLDSYEDDTEREECFEQISDLLNMHTVIEERHFYPLMEEKLAPNIPEVIREDHIALKSILGEMQNIDVSDESFDALLQRLKQEFMHHIQIEEQDLLPKAEQVINARQLNLLEDEMRLTMSDLEEEMQKAREGILLTEEEEEEAYAEAEEEPRPSA